MNEKQQVGKDGEYGEDSKIDIELIIKIDVGHDTDVLLFGEGIEVGGLNICFC